MFQLTGAPPGSVQRPRRDALRLFSALIKASDYAAAVAGINDVPITRIRRDIPGLAAANVVPVFIRDHPLVGIAGRNRDCRVVLLSPVEVIRKSIVSNDVI